MLHSGRFGAHGGLGSSWARKRTLTLQLCLIVAAIACWTLPVDPAVADEGCFNEARRAQQASTFLPDCRAYELVTPAEKDSGEPKAVEVGLLEQNLTGIEGAHASVEGTRMAWDSEYVLPGSHALGVAYLSTRSSTGWSSQNMIPSQTVENGLLCPNIVVMAAYSRDLSAGVLADGFGQGVPTQSYLGEGLECGHDEPRLVPGEQEGFQNLFHKDNESGKYELINVTPEGVSVPKATPATKKNQHFPAAYLAGSSDLKQVVFENELQLTPEAPLGDDLYEWNAGIVRLVTILPDGSPVIGRLGGATRGTTLEQATNTFVPTNIADFRHAVSSDGSRVFFQAEGKLYVRKNAYQVQSPVVGGQCTVPALACTVQIDKSTVAGLGGGGEFIIASADGSRVFFTDSDAAGLTSNTVPGSGINLYEYNVETGDLRDLTPDAEAGVKGVAGASEDGSRLYFVATGGSLASSAATGGSAAAATPGEPNIYLLHDGVTTFIATLNALSDSCDWTANTGCLEGVPQESGLTSRVPENGEYIGFSSVNKLSGANNVDANTGEPDREIYLYEASDNKLVCASCSPTGEAPVAPSTIRYPAVAGSTEMRNAYPQRNVSNNGQVFFETSNSLIDRDTNGQRDVYEYREGALSLISSGTSEAGSYFLDATPSGSDVFFATAQPLVKGDIDSVYDYYDARVDGGFEEVPVIGSSCSGEGCRASSSGSVAPVLFAPGSMNFAPSVTVTPVSKKPTKTVKKKAKKRKKKNAKRKKSRKGKEKPSKVKGKKSRNSHAGRGIVR